MKYSSFLVFLAASSLVSARFNVNQGNVARQAPIRTGISKRDLVNSSQLVDSIELDALLAREQQLQDFAFAYPDRNRVFGLSAHNDTVYYVYNTLKALDGYYNVSLQEFTVTTYIAGDFSLAVNDTAVANATLFQYSPNGNATDELVQVNNLGCNSTDFPAEVDGHIALISRGDCEFGLKVALAGSAGALGAVIYNNAEGNIVPGATLGEDNRPEGRYVPAIGVSQAAGQAWIAHIQAGNSVTASISVTNSSLEDRSTLNANAQTTGGDQDNILHLGAHSDSVEAGPGINDNGSGSVSILEVAVQLAKYTVNNAVKFSWWSAEEEGLLGSEYYVSQLSDADINRTRLYLNFDMTASPNYRLAAYDGDGSTFNVSGAPGSAEAEKLFHDFLASQGQNSTDSEFDGRSDYGPFLDVGIACGGLDTGAEKIKTEEEEAMFGGQAGVAYDVNYHSAGDTFDNVAHTALLVNAKAMAHAVATYGASFESFPPRLSSVTKRSAEAPSYKFKYKGGTVIM